MRATEFITEEAKAAKYNGLVMKYAFNNNALVLKAFDPTKTPIAYVKFVKEDKELYPQDLWVHDDYRNRGIAKLMYDFLKSQGYIINRSHDQTKAGAGFWDKHRGENSYVWENVGQTSTTLNQLYNGNFPDRDESFWDEVTSSDFDKDLAIHTMPKHKVQIMLLSQYRVEHLDDITDMMDEDQQEVVQRYMNDPALSTKVIVISGNRIIDGNHRALAAAFNGSSINYVDLADLDEDLSEEVLDEMPLPADWDPQQMRQQGTSFKSRLQYALDRAKKLGTGSSRVATVIEYQGRPTVLKIAKNQKGLAQNSVEADILSDGYASQLGILIPLIDYDEQNREPSWIHTEMATKASEKQLCSVIKCDNLSQLVNMAWAITGKKKFVGNYDSYVKHMQEKGKSEQDIETMTDYANTLADLNSNFDVELGDFARAANWGFYQGKPVIVDVGFNSNVLNQYYKR